MEDRVWVRTEMGTMMVAIIRNPLFIRVSEKAMVMIWYHSAQFQSDTGKDRNGTLPRVRSTERRIRREAPRPSGPLWY